MVSEIMQKEFLFGIKIYFPSIKINFYSIKYIYMISSIYISSIEINLYLKSNIFVI